MDTISGSCFLGMFVRWSQCPEILKLRTQQFLLVLAVEAGGVRI